MVLTREDFPEAMRPHRWIETQNFVPPGDDQLTVTGYEVNNTANSEAFLFDLKKRTLVNVSRSPDHYEEVEGVFPDGKHTLVERAEHRGNHWPLIDAWKLSLDGSGESERLTFFTEYKGYKGGEPTVSDDGRYVAFTLGKSGMEAGQGFGIFVLDMGQEP
jgi:Tol biopolymer transport system component